MKSRMRSTRPWKNRHRERRRELVQASTSGSTELAASSDQMSKMSRGLLDSMDRFALRSEPRAEDRMNDRMNERPGDRFNDSAAGRGNSARTATAGSR